MVGLAGKRVLLVEDHMLIAMEVEDILRELGCVVVGPVNSLATALRLACDEALDLAILDVSLDGEQQVFPVAEKLEARGVPLIFATGFGEASLPEKWRDRPNLGKPFRRKQLEQLVKRIANA